MQCKQACALILLLVCVMGVFTACNMPSDPVPKYDKTTLLQETAAWYSAPVGRTLNAQEQVLYNRTIHTLLKEDLWTERDAYDACHYLMVPMHYAFRSNDHTTVTAFVNFFSRFEKDVFGADVHMFSSQGTLNSLHFYYLCTQFMSLCISNNKGEMIPRNLPFMAERYAMNYLMNTTANWKTEATVIEHMEQVIAGKKYSRSYYSAIEDFDRFTLAILCDLRYLTFMQGKMPSKVMDTAADIAYRLFSSPLLNTETEQGGWLFQAGVWWDYRDYAYAGHKEITENMQPHPVKGICEDSSHSHRMPLWLRSYQSAQDDSFRYNLFVQRREQLLNQMINTVLKKVDGNWLTTTFMNGKNGVYRYSYNTEGVGLVGYDLSGTFLLGWWAFLTDDQITSVYSDILKAFPMTGDISNPYFDHVTKREQNPYFDMETGFALNMFEVMTLCATCLMSR